MLELYLIRHPETEGGGNLIKGHLDIGLKPGWEARVDAIAAELSNQGPFDAFFSSDLQRAKLPAERIVKYLESRQGKQIEFEYMECLRERELGILQGKRFGEVETQGKSLVDYVFEEEDILEGESKSDTIKRVETFVKEYLQKYISNGRRVGMVGHGWWISYLINSWLHNHKKPYTGINNLEVIKLTADG